MEDLLPVAESCFDFLVTDYGFERTKPSTESLRYVTAKVFFEIAYDDRDGLAVSCGRLGHLSPDGRPELLDVGTLFSVLDSFDVELEEDLLPRRWPSPVQARIEDYASALSRFGAGLILGDDETYSLLSKVRYFDLNELVSHTSTSSKERAAKSAMIRDLIARTKSLSSDIPTSQSS